MNSKAFLHIHPPPEIILGLDLGADLETKEYSALEGTHQDHRAQLLSE